MNALQPSQIPSPKPSRQAAPRVQRAPRRVSSRRTHHRTIALEVSARLGVNLILGIAALSALVRLLPYNVTQQARLEELRTEVAEVEDRVNHLRAEFSHNFDPHRAMSVMQEQSARMHPNQRQIIWLAPSSNIAEEPVEEEVRQNRRQTWTARD
ncbi:hypothetical protein C7B61_13065 [filamentous cyanobacterium CCP1]|nr:hypothetical protein C7B76_08990 [filamentous cyanobacterium CCP2]PSB63675.1 hypothetical protein C7B61_13065 [filamentous cyanobacterium CCP1]